MFLDFGYEPLRHFIPLHFITLTYLIVGFLFKKIFLNNTRKSTIYFLIN